MKHSISLHLVFVLVFSNNAPSFTSAQNDKGAFEIEEGLALVLSNAGEDCETACEAHESICTFGSLEAGAPYGTSKVINGTATALGRLCRVAEEERLGRAFPVIDERDHCYAAPGANRNNYDCKAVSTLNSGGRRLCSCFTLASLPGPAPTYTPGVSGGNVGANNAPPAPSEYVPDGFFLNWRDDFDGDSLDTTNWSNGLTYDFDPSQHVIWHGTEGGPGLLNAKYDGYILERNAFVRNGLLNLANKEETIQGTNPTGTFKYTSGWINSLHKRFFNGAEQSIYLEVRATFPRGQKVWPAIWLVAEEPTWPPEIDIWEYFGKFFGNNNKIDEMHLRNIWGHFSDKKAHVAVVDDFAENFSGYHTFGWLWTNLKMVWYIDGVEVGQKVKGNQIPGWGWADEDMCLVINNGLMSEVDAEGTNFPNWLRLDYIALYKELDVDNMAPSPPVVNVPSLVPSVAPTMTAVPTTTASPATTASPTTTERPSSVLEGSNATTTTTAPPTSSSNIFKTPSPTASSSITTTTDPPNADGDSTQAPTASAAAAGYAPSSCFMTTMLAMVLLLAGQDLFV
mmetsp:Transcript_42260/g.62626  ORF Transcript_42260/g.62626 Transcript_42260/m.62626 type:complete len:567 (-) Transcript_42260:395-2095(-)